MKGRIIASSFALLLALSVAPEAALAGWSVSFGITLPGLSHYEAAPVPPLAPAPYGPIVPAVRPAYFYGGLWYQLAGGRWFVAAELAGPWSPVAAENVPSAVVGASACEGPGRDADEGTIAPRLNFEGDDE